LILDKAELTRIIKNASAAEGFQFCGISKAEFLEEEAPRLEQWLNQGMHGEMGYMANHFDKRLDPRKLVDGAKSVISLIYNYYPEEDLSQDGQYKVAKYAYGKDYHYVIKPKLKTVLQSVTDKIGEVNARVFVDSAPVHERAWAAKAGLGWVGKTCSKCMDACPTNAIPKPYVVDGSRCISYLTIELKDQLPSEFQGKMQSWMFGCDICQDVCPWNRFSKSNSEPSFEPNDKLGNMDTKDWQEMTEELFREIFKGSAVKRTKYSGLKRNIDFLNKKDGCQ
jgi:epoxyqueuosine reductase